MVNAMEYVSKMRSVVGHEPLLLVAAGVILFDRGKVLLQKRTDNGTWAIHGGALDLGETTEDAARRELYEETGIVAGALTFYGVFSGENMHYFYPNKDEVYLVSVVYFCNDFTGLPKADNNEVIEIKWFPVDSLPSDINKPVDNIILAGLKNYLADRNLC